MGRDEVLSTGMESDDELLIARLRKGVAIILFSLSLFFATDLVFGQPGLEGLLVIKVVQLASLAGGHWVLGRRKRAWPPRRIGVCVVVVIYLTTAMSSAIRHDVATSSYLFLALAMGTASFVPWGARAQLASVVAGGIALLGNYALAGVLVEPTTLFPGLAALVAFVASVAIASNDEAHRQQRRAFEQELEASRRRLEEESLVSGALARAGHAMISFANDPDILDRACVLVAELLGCDRSTASLRQSDRDGGFAVEAAYGYSADDREAMRCLRAPANLVGDFLRVFERDQAAEVVTGTIADPVMTSLHRQYGVASSLYVPLRRGGEVVGILSAHLRAEGGRFSSTQRRMAIGIANLVSLALENTRLVAELRSASQLKSEFVSTMSHELRTPVSVILGYAEILGDTASPVERADLLEKIRRTALGLNAMIEETLDLSRLEAGKDPLRLESFDLRDLFVEVAAELTATSPRAIPVRWEGESAVDVDADRRKLRIVLKNLIGNALKFTPAGEVVVESDRSGGALSLSVRDTGIGIAPEHVPIIFEMFRQVDASDARSYQGVGLGLYIVHQLVTRMGGNVTVESQLGRGSCFTVTLPVQPDPLEPRDPAALGRE